MSDPHTAGHPSAPAASAPEHRAGRATIISRRPAAPFLAILATLFPSRNMRRGYRRVTEIQPEVISA